VNWTRSSFLAIGLSLLLATCWASPADFRKAVASAKTHSAIQKAWQETGQDRDFVVAVGWLVEDILDQPEEFSADQKEILAAVDSYLEVRKRVFEPKSAQADQKNLAKELENIHKAKTDAISEDQKESNWLARAFEKIKRAPAKPEERPSNEIGTGSGLGWMSHVITFLLYATVGAALAFALWATRGIWQKNRSAKSKAGALLSEDEPNRRADEWLQQADALTAQGKYREACRSLYLAMLVRMDEARIMRFDRAETNWEHLHRLQAIHTRPPGVDITAATKKIDVVWYGQRCEGLIDVEWFKAEYVRNLQAIERKGIA
jgi:hypothetical protein